MGKRTLGKKVLVGALLCIIFGFGMFAGVITWQYINNEGGLKDSAESNNSAIIDTTAVVYEEHSVEPVNSTKMIIGLSKIVLRKESKESVGVQVDRVIRDYLWSNSSFDIRVPANRVPDDFSQIVCYMEGARVREMMGWADISVVPLTPSIALRKEDGYYYGSDGQGNFVFQICPDKTDYPTCEFKKEDESDYVVMHDTHGFNAIAEQAYLSKDRISLVIACMDMPDKAKAALYLAQNGVQCYAPCDRFTNELMGYKEKYGMETEILGSAPIRQTNYGAIIGDQSIEVLLNELIIAQYTDRMYPDQYCDTPSRYFRKLQEVYGINLLVTEVYANVGETSNLVREAEKQNAGVIGARIFNESDYVPLKEWLEKDRNNRVILFHSAAYEFGIKLFREFPGQTSFGDINPIFVEYEYEINRTCSREDTKVSALISFTFDDNKPNQLEYIAPLMGQYNMTATSYYITNVSWTNFNECKILQDQYGWEIGGHTKTHPDLTNITLEEAREEICGSRDVFIANGIDVKSFAPPYTKINEDKMNIVKECYESCRDDWEVNYPPYEPYRIRMIFLDNMVNATIPEISNKIDEAIKYNGWIVFVAHSVDSTGNPYSTDGEFFRELLDDINKKQEVKVVTVSEALAWNW